MLEFHRENVGLSGSWWDKTERKEKEKATDDCSKGKRRPHYFGVFRKKGSIFLLELELDVNPCSPECLASGQPKREVISNLPLGL